MKLASSILLSMAISATAVGQIRSPWWGRAQEHRAGAYVIKTDLPASTTSRLAARLNIMYDQYAKRLSSLPQRAPDKLNVLIFSSPQDYQSVLRIRFGVDARRTSGMFFVNKLGTALAFWSDDRPHRREMSVLQHEAFHQFAYSRFGDDLPPWVDEGLAEYFGAGVLVGKQLELGELNPRVLRAVQDAIESDRHIPFSRMLRLDSDDWKETRHNGDAGLLYNQAWTMVHFLIHGDRGAYVRVFEEYLRLVNKGVLPDDAFAQAFGTDIEPFERRWRNHVMRARPGALVTALERIEFLAEGALELNRHGINPAGVPELREKLMEIQFTYPLGIHGIEIPLRGADPQMYTLVRPAGSDPDAVAPSFVVRPINPGRLTRRERRIEEKHPSPPVIATEGLSPRNLRVRWIRRKDTPGVFTYELEMQ